MNASWIGTFLILVVILSAQHEEQDQIVRRIVTQNENPEELQSMKALAQTLLDRDCIVYIYNNQLEGIIREVDDTALRLERKDGTMEIVNLNYVVRIREYPKKKNGKKKDIVLD